MLSMSEYAYERGFRKGFMQGIAEAFEESLDDTLAEISDSDDNKTELKKQFLKEKEKILQVIEEVIFYTGWTDEEIAKECKCDTKIVKMIRKWSTDISDTISAEINDQ